MELRKNQLKALEITIKMILNLSSFSCYGTGKSWISLEIILKYNENIQKQLLWLCEQKSILVEQFEKVRSKKKDIMIFLLSF